MSTAPLPANPDPSPGPQHVAIIMDGNGRWAKARGLPRVAGHRRGAEAVRRVRPWCVDVASGVEERPGVKDLAKVRAFVEAVRSAG